MRLPRASGILLHPTSLPGPFGVGDIGPTAESFLQLLAETGQRWWQMLPIGPTGVGDSPYQSPSSFAGHALLISPERLVEDGLLQPHELQAVALPSLERADFVAANRIKTTLLQSAFTRFQAGPEDPDFVKFTTQHDDWLDDYTLFAALREEYGDLSWTQWEPEIVRREPETLKAARKRLAERIRYHQFVQYVFDRQWRRLRQAALARGIRLIGDVPIFVALDSADVWAHPDLYFLDERLRPTEVSGVPPDIFSATGQLWGNPLYRWEAHKAQGYAWWIERMRASLERFELVRLDHFRGFEAYWSVPAGEPTTVNGQWVPGPGADLLAALRTAFGGLPLIAEDLGLITPGVEALRDTFDLPGMRVLQFGFTDPKSTHLPHFYGPHSVVYTGTHDNDTCRGWFDEPPDGNTDYGAWNFQRDFVRRYVSRDGREIHWDMVRLALASVADTAILPIQDVLGLGRWARMNVPGVGTGNWGWRLHPNVDWSEPRRRLSEMTGTYNRWNSAS